MRQFFKFFFASLLALVVFVLLGVFILIGLVGALASKEEVVVNPHAVLYLDLGNNLREQSYEKPFAALSGDESYDQPGVYDMVQLIRYAKKDDNVDGLYLKCGSNANGFGTNEELRNVLNDFRRSGKFLIAYGEAIPQQAYHVANVSDKVYVHPKGGIDWKGFGLQYVFFKKALDKLEIQPQIFYAGKFKSATEPFREEKMTDANRLQSKVLLEDLYQHFLESAAASRGLNAEDLRRLADSNSIRSAHDAQRAGLCDGLKYEDEVKEEIRRKSSSKSIEQINFISMAKYGSAVNYKGGKGTDRIALIYAQGDIVDGSGNENQVGGDRFRKYIRKARLDDKVKAVVVRINSGGGSAMASENMWREIELARKDKPVIVSFGDVAASGGYYMGCSADSIFAQPNTITGSIGVFSIVPNLQGFFRDKLGVTFDGVETGPYANAPSIAEPLSDTEKRFFQADVDSIYETFLGRVAAGRKKTSAEIDSIGQGRVWTGSRAVGIGLVDRIGGISEAIAAAAKMGGIKEYRLREYPERIGLLERLTGAYKQSVSGHVMEGVAGTPLYDIYREVESLKATFGKVQTKMPYYLILR